MSNLFLKILNMSIAAGWLILAVVLLRFLLKKAPRWITVLLWRIAALRLAVPFSFESAWSLVPSAETFQAHNIQYETPVVNSGIPAVNNAVNPLLGEMFAPNPAASVNPLYVWTFVLSVIWLMGMAILLLYTVISYWQVHRSVSEGIPYEGNIFLCDQVKSPFILGLVRPKIYLPSNMNAVTMEPVIAHEKAHLARRDHWWKPLGFLIMTVHWFNPLCWIAYVLLCRDIEMACDEKVIRQIDLAGKKQYSMALLECSTGQRQVTICPLAFGEIDVKERVKNVLNYKKPAFWVVLVSLALCAAAAVCFLTDPKTEKPLPAPEGDFFTISNPLLSSIPPRWEDPDTVAAMAELLDGLTYQPAAEERAESQTMALSLDLVVQGKNRRLLVCPNGVGTLDGAEGWVSFDDTGLYALLRSYYSQATGVTAYTGGQLLYELASLNYLPPDGSHYARVLEEGPFLTILDGEGETVFAGELDRTRTYSRREFLTLFDSYAQAGGLDQMVPTEVTEVAERFYRKDSQDASGMAVWELSLEGGGTWLWLSEGTPPLRLYELIDLDQAFPFLMPGSGGGFGGYLWTCNPGYGLPIRFAGEFDHVTLYAREDTLRGTDGTPTDSLTLAPGEVVRWDPGAVDMPPDSAVLHYYIHQPDGTVLEDYLELRTVSKAQGLYGSRTYGAAIDWLGLASSKLHQVRLTADGDSLVLSSGPFIYLGTATLQGERTDPIGTEDAPAEG